MKHTPVLRVLLLGNGTPVAALDAVKNSANSAPSCYEVYPYLQGHGARLPQLGEVIDKLQQTDVLLFAPGGASIVPDSQVQVFEADVLKAVFCQPRAVSIILYLADWRFAAAKHVKLHADKLAHVVIAGEVDEADIRKKFGETKFTRVQGEAPGLILTVLRKSAQASCA